jgi:hypothetical protein
MPGVTGMQTLGISTVAALAAVLALASTGCGMGDFNYGKVGNLLQDHPVHLDAEYVMLTQGQVDCGVQEDLWDAPPPLKGTVGERVSAHLTDKARRLKFSDDVTFGELRYPFAQIRGDVNLQVIDIQSDRNGPEPNTKLVDIKMGVKVDHTCFQTPLLLLGVHKGNFTEDYPPELLFRLNNVWEFDKFVH